jgi:thymidylate synthase (FAD)
MPRLIATEAEKRIDVPVKVLDHGEVMLIDYLGTDARVVDAARTSYTTGTKKMSEDRALIHHLMRNAHTSPFEQVVLVFRLVLPLFVAAQFARHRTARLNAESFRFSEATDKFYLPDHLRNQDTVNKQGSIEAPFKAVSCPECDGKLVIEVCEKTGAVSVGCPGCDGTGAFKEHLGLGAMRFSTQQAFAQYQKLIKAGVSRELARTILPQSLYTTWYWQVDLHNLFHFLRLRLDWHAQYEIRVYAQALAEAAKAVAPICYEAFEEHVLYGVRLSRAETEAVRHLLRTQLERPEHQLDHAAAQFGIVSYRQVAELRKKVLPPVSASGDAPTLGGDHAA